MTDKHPLHPKLIDALSEYRTCDEAMRAAADWQLEQVINWIRCSPWVGSDCPIYDFEDEQDRLQLIADIKKSMRPITTQDDN